ncbi:MAG: flagellin [Alphaproteobacteria bacterium]
MALNIVSNYAANVATRYLSKADTAASQSLAKLSAGTRVLGAKDDAASLAIGSRLNAEVQAQKQAKVNAGQATSMLQIADGAMSKVNDILVRMKTLAVQAGSGQLSNTERSMLDTEYQALMQEIDRIASDTEFNGTSLVNGSSTTTTTLNANANSNIQAADGFASIRLGNDVGTANILVAYDSTTDVLTLTNKTTGESQGIAIGNAAIASNQLQTVNFDQLGIVVELNSAFDKSADIVASTPAFTAGSTVTGVIDLNSISVTSTDTAGLAALATGNLTIDTATASASVLTVGGFTSAAVDLSSTGSKSVVLTDSNSNSVTLNFDVTTLFGDDTDDSSLNISGQLANSVFGSAGTAGTTSFTFKLGTGTTANVDEVTINVGAVSTDALGIDGSDITSKANADTASVAVSAAIDRLSNARAGVGAAQNRLEFASDNLASTIENTEAARSSLLDLDVASEMTAFTAKQVLVQSGVAMLAQANQMPQNLLRLFQ